MALKRQREDESLLNVKSWISCFGEEEIHEITKQGNATFARGAFGELSIAIRQSSDDDNDHCRFVAIKTIERTLTSSAPFAKGKQQLSRDVFNELCALRYLNPHPNIVPLVAVYPAKQAHLSRTSLSLAFTYSPVDLYLSLGWRRRAFLPLLPFGVVKTIARDVFAALAHSHSFGVLHRDVNRSDSTV
jgi:serine/threonine protein kinase